MTALYRNRQFQALILDLNFQSQLYEQGIDSKGEKLVSPHAQPGEVYAPYTIVLKTIEGQPTDRVTLKDAGEFYRSGKVIITMNSDLKIIAETEKPDGTDLMEEWGSDILGLTEESMDELRDLATEIIRDEVKKIIQGSANETQSAAA